MTVKNAKDFWSGIMFAAIGLFAIIVSQEHDLGSAARMGPAYFPTVLGILLTAVGLVIAIIGLVRHSDDGHVARFNWRVIILILGSVFAFSLLLHSFGLMIAIAAMIILSLLADSTFHHWKEAFAIVAVLDLLAWAVFVYGVGMLVPVWPTFF